MKKILDEIPVLICKFLPDTTLTYVNKEYCNFFNKSEKDLLETKFIDFVPENEIKNVYLHLKSFSKKNYVKNFEHYVYKTPNKITYLQWTDKAFFDNKDKIQEFISYGFDITEKVLLEQEQKFKANILDLVSDAVIVHDFSGKIIYANEAAYQKRNYSKTAFYKKNIQDIINLKNKKLYTDRLNIILKNKQHLFQSEHLTKNKQRIPVETKALLIKYQGKQLILSICRDITEKKEKEQELKNYLIKLKNKNIALDEVLNSIEKQKENVREFLSNQIEMLIIPLLKKLELKCKGFHNEEKEYIKICRKELTKIISKQVVTDKNMNLLKKLTPKQIEICQWIKKGLSSKEIAQFLHISTATVEQHRHQIRKKLDVENNLVNYLKELNF
jgi:PAS domain S-box-containing protein